MSHSSASSGGDDFPDGYVAIANELFRKFHIPAINNLSDCTSSSFTALYEGILGDRLHDIIRNPVTREDEIHNVQCVVDSLATDVLHCDLSHITGRSVVDGDPITIRYLLEILVGLVEYVMEQIESETSSDVDDLKYHDALTTERLTATEDVRNQSKEHKRKRRSPRTHHMSARSTETLSLPSSISMNSDDRQEDIVSELSDSTAELIKLGEESASFRPSSRTRSSKTKGKSPSYETDLGSTKVRRSSSNQRHSLTGLDADISEGPLSQLTMGTQSPVKDADQKAPQNVSSSFSSVSWPRVPSPLPTHPASHPGTEGEMLQLGSMPIRTALTSERVSPYSNLLGSLIGEPSTRHHVTHTHRHYHSFENQNNDDYPPATKTSDRTPEGPATSNQYSKSPLYRPSSTVTQDVITQPTTTSTQSGSRRSMIPSASHYETAAGDDLMMGGSRWASPGARAGQSLDESLGRSTRSGAGRRWASESLVADQEDSYDKSFMRRKVARRRRVAFKDDVSEMREYSDIGELETQHLSLRSDRISSDEDDDDDAGMVSYHHDDLLMQYGRHPHTEKKEEEPAEDDHIRRYDLRPRTRFIDNTKAVRKGSKAPPQRSVLLPKSLPPAPQPSALHFEDAMNSDAKGLMGKVRRRLAKEAVQQGKLKEVLGFSYAGSLKEVKKGVDEQAKKREKVTKQLDSEYKAIHGKPKTSQYKPARKYAVPVTTTSSKSSRRPSRAKKRSPPTKRKRDPSLSPTSPPLGGDRPLRIGDDDILPTLMHEFPFLHVSPHTAHRMWEQQMRHMEHLTKSALSHKYKKPKMQIKMEDAEKRQDILVKIMKKDVAHNQRMKEIRERSAQERTMRAKAREQRQVNARARRYYDEFRLRARSRALKRRTKEEQVFKHLFEEGMEIQKARIRELRKYAQEKREEIAQRQQDEIDSLENYYRDQFSMLAEAIATERHDLRIRDTAQAKVMDRMKKDMRTKMEKEIRDFQEQLYRDEDAEYFRQLEADRMRHELQIAKYKAQL